MVTGELADELIDLHENARLAPPFTERNPGLTPAKAYEAATALHARRLAAGWKPIGRKIGFTNRTLWTRYGVYEPIWGTVYDRTLETNPGSFSLRGLVQPRIEPEICFGLKAAPPVTRDPERLLASIEWIGHSIEVVQCHHPDWKMQLADCCAGNGLHGRLLVGERVPVSRIPNLADLLPKMQVTLKMAGKIVDRGAGANVLDSPLLALAYFVEVLAKQPGAEPLRPGELVSTGTITDAHPVAQGETWSTEIDGLPLPGHTLRFA
jgi:2-oxo-3-hexenedioate decarboxylase